MENSFKSVFAIKFPPTEYGDNYKLHNEKWGWEGVLYDMCNGDILNYNNVCRMGLYECLWALSIKNERGVIETKINNEIQKKLNKK